MCLTLWHCSSNQSLHPSLYVLSTPHMELETLSILKTQHPIKQLGDRLVTNGVHINHGESYCNNQPATKWCPLV